MRNKKNENYRYIEVKGIEREKLDRYLVSIFPTDYLGKLILSEPSLAKSIPYNKIQLMSQSIPDDELIDAIVQHLHSNYNVYNSMMNNVMAEMQRLEDKIKKEKDYLAISGTKKKQEYFYNELKKELKDDSNGINKLICWLRLKASMHNKIFELINEEKEMEEKNFMEDENSMDFDELNKQISFSDQISLLKQIILSMEDKTKEIDFSSYEKLKDKNSELTEIKNNLEKELTGKEKEIKSKNREIQRLQKKLDDELKKRERDEEQIKKHQQSLGEMGTKLGEMKTELEKVKQENKLLERKVTRMQNDNKSLEDNIKAEYEQKVNIRVALLKSEYEDKIYELERTRETEQKMHEQIHEDLNKKYELLEEQNKDLNTKLQELQAMIDQKDEQIALLEKNMKQKSENNKMETTDESTELADLFDTSFEPEFS